VRVGLGIDLHRFAADRRLVLGGVEIAHDLGLDGHSDADVLLHAIMDAALGAAGLADIGTHFPPNDPTFAGADSLGLLARVRDLLADEGWRVEQVDATIIAEMPKLAPHVPAMRVRIAAALGIEPADVGVKATTAEGLGALGRGEGIQATAIALLNRIL
jgi:2-C-methyl-D-erythritol 2,4-cyclodiphosphate synthase